MSEGIGSNVGVVTGVAVAEEQTELGLAALLGGRAGFGGGGLTTRGGERVLCGPRSLDRSEVGKESRRGRGGADDSERNAGN